MSPSARNKAPPREANGATEMPNKRGTRSTTKKATISPENTGENGSNSGRVTRAKQKATDNKTKHPKRQLPKSKKTAGRRVKKAVKGRNTVQQSDDVDEGERSDDPNSTVEEEQAHEDPPQKRRLYAPVTVLDNETSESDVEDEGNESEVMSELNGALSNPSRKRKRPVHSGADAQSTNDMNSAVAIDEVIPQAQNKDDRPGGQIALPTPSELPTTSPHHSPSQPHAILQGSSEDETAVLDKPVPKLTIRALRSARAEEPKFIDSGSDNEAPAGKRHKAAAGDGKKPLATKLYPVFDAVFKSATTELKRQICFVDAFPDAKKSDNLPRAVYNCSVHSVTESGLYSQDDLHRLTKGFDGQWFSCLNHRISSIRAQFKKITIRKVCDHFNDMKNETRNRLLATNKYWYEISAAGEANLGRPFLNKAIIDILKEYFEGRKSLYKLYPQEFKPSLVVEDGGKGLEIPPRLVALVATFIYYALAAEGRSVQNWKYETFGQIYDGHLAELKKIARDNPQCYHLILNRLFNKCIGDNGPNLVQPIADSRNDYCGLDPADFST